MSQKPNLEGLAAKISESTKAIISYLHAEELPEPSFAADGPSDYPKVPEVQGPRMELIEAAMDLLRMALGPKDYIFLESVTLHHDQAVLDVINQFDIWNAIPIGGSATYGEIAAKIKLPEELIRRILRYAMTMRLFAEAETGSGRVVHTATTTFVAQNPIHKSWMSHNLEEVATSCTKLPAALRMYSQGKDEPAQELHETSFAVEFKAQVGKDGNYWDFIEQDGEGERKGYRTKQFSEAMQVVHSATPIDTTKLIAEGFDWASLGNGTVVDVGGSAGHEAIALAKKFPNINFIVQDRPKVQQSFQDNVPSNLATRVTFQAHDFFKKQTVPADVYFMKSILHDWPDKHSVNILQALIPAMTPGARIILCEGVAPPIDGGEEWEKLPLTAKRMLAAADLQMLAIFNAKQRSVQDWKDLLKMADERLELANTFFLAGSATGILEIVFKG